MNAWFIRPIKGLNGENAAQDGVAIFDAGVTGDVSHVMSLEEAADLVISEQPGLSPAKQDSLARALYMGLAGIPEGDLLLIPLQSQNVFLVGVARAGAVAWGNYTGRRFDPIGIIRSLPADIKNAFSAKASVGQIRAPQVAKRLTDIIAGREQVAVDSCPWDGHEFANFVGCMMQLDGYLCKISPPGPDGGIDILAGRGITGTEDARIIQVKSVAGKIGVDEVDRLYGIVMSRRSVTGVLVCWAGMTESAARRVDQLWPTVSVMDRNHIMPRALQMKDHLPHVFHAGLEQWSKNGEGRS